MAAKQIVSAEEIKEEAVVVEEVVAEDPFTEAAVTEETEALDNSVQEGTPEVNELEVEPESVNNEAVATEEVSESADNTINVVVNDENTERRATLTNGHVYSNSSLSGAYRTVTGTVIVVRTEFDFAEIRYMRPSFGLVKGFVRRDSVVY